MLTQVQAAPGVGLDAFFAAASVAIVGASDDITKIGGRPVQLLRKYGYAGAIYPINPKGGMLQGLQAYASAGRRHVAGGARLRRARRARRDRAVHRLRRGRPRGRCRAGRDGARGTHARHAPPRPELPGRRQRGEQAGRLVLGRAGAEPAARGPGRHRLAVRQHRQLHHAQHGRPRPGREPLHRHRQRGRCGRGRRHRRAGRGPGHHHHPVLHGDLPPRRPAGPGAGHGAPPAQASHRAEDRRHGWAQSACPPPMPSRWWLLPGGSAS